MKRLFFCLALMLLPQQGWAQAASPPAAGASDTQADPVATVRWFYPLRAETEPPPYSARLQKLHDAADANSKKINAPVAGLDFAFQVNAQDTENGYEKTIRYALRRGDAKRARVRVSLRNMRAVDLRYDLVFENGRWLVDDVRSIREPRWALSRLYINGAREK